jgi:hypothetical protein
MGMSLKLYYKSPRREDAKKEAALAGRSLERFQESYFGTCSPVLPPLLPFLLFMVLLVFVVLAIFLPGGKGCGLSSTLEAAEAFAFAFAPGGKGCGLSSTFEPVDAFVVLLFRAPGGKGWGFNCTFSAAVAVRGLSALVPGVGVAVWATASAPAKNKKITNANSFFIGFSSFSFERRPALAV